MQRNVANQVICGQVRKLSDRTPFAGTVNVFVTKDGGTQTPGATGSGVCTNEGKGVYSYIPTAGETDAFHIVFTFEGSTAETDSVQVYPGTLSADPIPILGTPAGASLAADIAAVKALLPSALTSAGNMKAQVQGFLDSVFTEGAAGRIAQAFKQFFNIATPAATMDHGILVDTATVASTATAIAANGINSASFAADTGLRTLQSGTAQAGAASTITLASGASAVDNFFRDDLIILVGGAGAGQCRFASAYVGATKVATIFPNWVVNPDNTSVYAVRPSGAIASAPTVDQIASAVWVDLLASSDFSISGSVGKLLKDNLNAAITTRMASYTQPTGFLAATFPTGTMASTDNITTVAAVVAAPTSGDLTATMKTSVTTAAAAAVPSVNAASVRTALGMASPDLDTTLKTNIPALIPPIDGNGAVKIRGDYKKNTALANYTFMMFDILTHQPAGGLTVSVTRRIDSASFGAGTLSAVTDVGNGVYSVNFAAADMNGKVITLRATATNGDDTLERIVTID